MALRYLIDECSIAHGLRQALLAFSAEFNVQVDFVCVGEAGAPGFGTDDSELIKWAIQHDRAIVSYDANTLIGITTVLSPAGEIRHR